MALSDFLIAKKTSDARRDINKYSRKAGRAIGKQSKWANIGRTLGSALLPKLVMAGVGGPIGILGTAAFTGLGSYVGGKWLRDLARKTKGGKVGKVPEGTWLTGSREQVGEDTKDMESMLREQNMSSAVTAGATAGAKAFAKAGGFEALTGTGKTTFDAAGNPIKAPTVKSVLSKESLFGKTFDPVEGSPIDKLGNTIERKATNINYRAKDVARKIEESWHGFDKPTSNQPIMDRLEQASGNVPVNMEYVPGLKHKIQEAGSNIVRKGLETGKDFLYDTEGEIDYLRYKAGNMFQNIGKSLTNNPYAPYHGRRS